MIDKIVENLKENSEHNKHSYTFAIILVQNSDSN